MMAGDDPTGANAEGAAGASMIDKLINCRTASQLLEEYNASAGEYDECLEDVCTTPKHAADAVLRMYPKDGDTPRSELRVMDIAAGTGLVGRRLHQGGIRKLDGLEPSSGMLSQAQSHGIYQRLIQDTIGHHRIDVEDNTYDAVVVAGAFAPSHCPVTTLDEMIRICRPGGYIVNSMRLEFLVTVEEYEGMDHYMKTLEEEKKWRRIHRIIVDEYCGVTKQGVVFIYQKV